jgi:hypothetical protein
MNATKRVQSHISERYHRLKIGHIGNNRDSLMPSGDQFPGNSDNTVVINIGKYDFHSGLSGRCGHAAAYTGASPGNNRHLTV